MNLPSALRRHFVLALLPVVVLVAAGVTLGLRRSPTYTASAEINVGVSEIPTQATAAYVEASQELASEYSRQVGGEQIAQAVAKTTGLSAGAVAARLSASTIPTSPTFFINATGSTPGAAVRLSAAASAALKHQVNVIQQRQGNSGYVLGQYRAAQATAILLLDRQKALEQKEAAAATDTPSLRAQVRGAQLNAQVADLQARAIEAEYVNSATNSRGAIIQILNPAAGATSDRRSVTERYGLIGLAAGVLLGVLLALLADGARRRSVSTARVESPAVN